MSFGYPPKNRGVMRTRIDGIWGMPLSGPMTGRSRPHLSLREGSETPLSPRASSCRIGPRRQGFASRPGLLRADPKGWLFMRGKGGCGPCPTRSRPSEGDQEPESDNQTLASFRRLPAVEVVLRQTARVLFGEVF